MKIGGERLFYPSNNPMDVVPSSRVAKELLSLPSQESTGFTIRNGHCSAIISNKGTDKLTPEEKLRAQNALNGALQDTNRVELIPQRKLPTWFFHYFPNPSK